LPAIARRRLAATALALLGLIGLIGSRPLAGQGFGKNKIQYRDFDWKIYHSPHFDVYYYQQEEHLLEKVVSFAESAYDRLSREFDYQIKDPTPLIFYETHSAFEQNNIILNFIPEGVGAFASSARNRMVLPVDLPDPELLGLIAHELTHIFQYHILLQGRLGKALATPAPPWVMEGMASYMGKDEGPTDKMYLVDAVVNDLIPSITQSGVGGFFAYRFGHAAFDFMEERWGKEGFRDFIYEYRNTIGSQVGRAVERAFRIKPEDFDIEFRRWLRKKYLPELVRTGEVTAPIVIGRDHLDAGSVASPNRETEGMLDGTDAVSDWAILNALINAVGGATWVSFHHGGGVGIGFSQHAGQVIVADGTPEAARRLERVLTTDPGMGIVRHADAGYPEAIEAAKRHGIKIPMLK